ncbi:20102_t:CDS:1, partial [Dentiscutata erythropus]
EIVNQIKKMCDLTLLFDGWMDIFSNSIYAFLLHKFEDINKIINIENFFSNQHIANNLFVTIENLLKNVSVDFNNIIAEVTDSSSVMA